MKLCGEGVVSSDGASNEAGEKNRMPRSAPRRPHFGGLSGNRPSSQWLHSEAAGCILAREGWPEAVGLANGATVQRDLGQQPGARSTHAPPLEGNEGVSIRLGFGSQSRERAGKGEHGAPGAAVRHVLPGFKDSSKLL